MPPKADQRRCKFLAHGVALVAALLMACGPSRTPTSATQEAKATPGPAPAPALSSGLACRGDSDCAGQSTECAVASCVEGHCALRPKPADHAQRCELTPAQLSYQRQYEPERGERGVCRRGVCVPRLQCAELCATRVGPELYNRRALLVSQCEQGTKQSRQICDGDVDRDPALHPLAQKLLDECMVGCGFVSFETPPPITPPALPICTSDLCRNAQELLDLYIFGGKSALAQRLWPGAQEPGIVGRRPAYAGTAEYPARPQPGDGMRVAAGLDGPEGEGPYLFLDRCSLRSAIVSDNDEGGIVVRLVFVTRYPPGTFIDNHESVTRGREGIVKPNTMEVRLPTNVIDMIEHECTWNLMGRLGVDENGQSPRIGVHSEVISLEDLAALPTR